MERRTGGDLHWLGLRYTNVFGCGEDHKGPMASILSQMLRRAADGRPLVLFDDTLHACRDFVPVDVVVDTVLSLLADERVAPGIYNLGSGVPISFATIVRWCASFAGAELTVVLEPNPISSAYQYWTCADTSKLRASLPGRPMLTVADVRSAAGQLFEVFRARPRPTIAPRRKSGSTPVAELELEIRRSGGN
jgi:ADP-L-glycero-D-manno-heptose 6-epimerase